MLKCKYAILIVLMFLLPSSCNNEFFPVYIENTSMEFVEIDILKPASITIPPEINNILVISHPKYTQIRFQLMSGFIDSSSFTEKRILNEINSITRETLAATPRFSIAENSNSHQEITDLLANPETDGVLVLTTLQIKIQTNVLDWADNNYYNYSYHTATEIEMIAKWELRNNTGEVLNTKNTRYSEKIIGNPGYTKQEAMDNTPDLNEYVQYGIFVICDQISSYISPTWETIQRDYYSGGKAEFKEATHLIQNEQWDRAIQIWKQLYQTDHYVTKKHACYNLIFGYEFYGNLDSAIIMANKCYMNYDIKKAKDYKINLEQRIKQIEKINSQLYISQ